MTQEEYLSRAHNAYDNGKITEKVLGILIECADIFCEEKFCMMMCAKLIPDYESDASGKALYWEKGVRVNCDEEWRDDVEGYLLSQESDEDDSISQSAGDYYILNAKEDCCYVISEADIPVEMYWLEERRPCE